MDLEMRSQLLVGTIGIRGRPALVEYLLLPPPPLRVLVLESR